MPLSAAAIVEAAHRLLLDYGLQDVSMRRLAGELDVRPGALYYHVPSKQQLLADVAHRILAPLADPPGTVGVEELMRRFRATVLPIRDGADLMLIAFGLNPGLPPVPALRRGLERLGLATGQAHERAQIVMHFALGAVAAEQNAALLHPTPETTDRETRGPDATGPEATGPETTRGAALYDEGLRLLMPTAD